jgi:hypothetical protein
MHDRFRPFCNIYIERERERSAAEANSYHADMAKYALS